MRDPPRRPGGLDARSLSVAALAVALVAAQAGLPLARLQAEAWVAALLAFTVGDTVTTGLLGRYGLREDDRGLTYRLCGARPTMRCAAATRLLFTVGGVLVYLLLLAGRPPLTGPLVVRTAYLLPVGLAAGGLVATLLNTVAILGQVRRADRGAP